MKVEVVYLPSLLKPQHLHGRVVTVFDVLRATTTMTAALSAGVGEIQIFLSVDAARAARQSNSDALLCGEERCLAPKDFDLGNSPGGFSEAHHAGKTVLMATTNGTRAILAARGAARLLVGAIVNASAVARTILHSGLDATLLCAGTNGEIAMEDILGAGAVVDALVHHNDNVQFDSDCARAAWHLFTGTKHDLLAPLRESSGGRNVIEAGLPDDIRFAAQLDGFDIVGEVLDGPLRVILE